MTEFQKLRERYKKTHGKYPPPGTSTDDLRRMFTRKRRKSSSRTSTKAGGFDWTFTAWSK